MFGQTIFISNPTQLSLRDSQLVIRQPGRGIETSRPLEDIAFLVLDHPQIQMTQSVVQCCLDNNVMVIYCDEFHMPSGMLMPFSGHHLHQGRLRLQLQASQPLKNRIWQTVIQAKITNQAKVLAACKARHIDLERLVDRVSSGDKNNIEAQASRLYWSTLFTIYVQNFTRNRDGIPPNNLLNYGYAILRSAVARAVAGAGLLPVLGIHHDNQYNAFCLVDDLMEPYRPFVDILVIEYHEMTGEIPDILSKEQKVHLLALMEMDVKFSDNRSPMQTAIERSVHSFVKSLESRKCCIEYGQLPAYTEQAQCI
jgi:CRISPR-associated protein Cas1